MGVLDIGKKVLVTLDTWFTAPDGSDYKCVFGTVKDMQHALDALGIVPDHPKVYLTVGNITVEVQCIVSVIKTDTCVLTETQFQSWGNGTLVEFERKSLVYNADQEG